MSEMFNSLYDDIFIQNDNKVLPNDKISNNSKKYLEGGASLEDKRLFLKLKREYFKIKNIKDYKALQKKLYSNMNKSEIISFETVRILNSPSVNSRIAEQISNIRQILELNDGDLSDELYNKMANLIIMAEISLNIKVGLFSELCSFFENEIDKIDENVLGNSGYTKKK